MPALAELDERTEEAPVSPVAADSDAPPLPPAARPVSTLRCFGVALAFWAVAIGVAQFKAVEALAALFGAAGAIVFFVATMLAFSRAAAGTAAIVRGVRSGDPAGIAATAWAVLGNLVMTGFGMLVAYLTTFGFSRGRQLRRRGKVLLPDVRSNDDWTGVTMETGDAVPAGLADQWRENGRTEHASVAAFARLTLDLIALGAPPALIAAANQDALDEIRHAELCFSLARALDGKAISPAPFPEAQRARALPRSRTLALAKLAVTSLIDGALHEGVSARIVARLARRCEVPAIRAALREIAADEGRHSAHGWAAVEWCLEEGGLPVAEALLGALRSLPEAMHSQLPGAAQSGDWERWGIHGRQLESEEYRAARAHVVGRVHARMAAARPAA